MPRHATVYSGSTPFRSANLSCSSSVVFSKTVYEIDKVLQGKDVIIPKCPISVGFKKRELAARPNKHYGIKASSSLVKELIKYLQE